MQLGCGLQAAGMLKQEKELRGQTQALTWTAEAESKRDGAAGSRLRLLLLHALSLPLSNR